MRIYLHTSPNRELVPFNYQPALVGAFHKWLGQNGWHDEISLYSLSWLQGGRRKGAGLDFPNGATFFISSHSKEMMRALMGGIPLDPNIRFGMQVAEITMKLTPDFGEQQRFIAQSPILIKRQEGENLRFYFPEDQEANQLLTETLQHKLVQAGMLNKTVQVAFDRSYPNPKTKVATYKGVHNKGTLCPMVVEGDAEAVAFAWEVGLGNSTGIGFGALK